MTAGLQISLQTFTIRRFLKDTRKLTHTLNKVKSLGISRLELARVPFKEPYIKLIAEACTSAGVAVGSTQMKLKHIEQDRDWTVKMHSQLNCPYCVISVVAFTALKKGAPGIKVYAERLNNLGRYLKKRGVTLLFHHHNYEFVPIGDSDGFSLLKEYLDPEAVGFVFDTYWLQRIGCSPADFIREHRGLVHGVHLRDFTLQGPLLNPRIRDTELGRGNLNFPDILAACREVGVSYAAIEQDSSDPWRSLAVSTAYLRSIGVTI
ncbi:MAG: sugar phosphate isomerase/epimerase [Spirochaetia bacterium]